MSKRSKEVEAGMVSVALTEDLMGGTQTIRSRACGVVDPGAYAGIRKSSQMLDLYRPLVMLHKVEMLVSRRRGEVDRCL